MVGRWCWQENIGCKAADVAAAAEPGFVRLAAIGLADAEPGKGTIG